MVSPSDIEYKETKLIKQGKKSLGEPFKELAEWIGRRKGVTILNIVYDKIDPDDRPRLQIITEKTRDQEKFQEGIFWNFKAKEQDAVAEQFKKILKRDRIEKYDTDRLFVVFSPFEPIAKEEANRAISEREILRLKEKINNPNLWTIERCFGAVAFLFYTDAQVEESEREGLKEIYTDTYFEIIKKYDEFGYLKRDEFQIEFDSKENFDTNYQSNWFYYWR